MKLIIKREPEGTLFCKDSLRVVVKDEITSIDDALQTFTAFLRACGFVIDGELAIVSDDDENIQDY